jgi:hypothetical protein
MPENYISQLKNIKIILFYQKRGFSKNVGKPLLRCELLALPLRNPFYLSDVDKADYRLKKRCHVTQTSVMHIM